MTTYAEWIDVSARFLKQGNHGAGMRILDGLISQYPGDPIALYLLGSAYLDKEALGTAIVMLEQSCALGEKMPEPHHNLGVAYRKSERYEESFDSFLRAYNIDRTRADTMAMLAGGFINQGNPSPGVEWARKCLEAEPGHPHAMNHMALCLLEMGKWDEAWPYWEKRWLHPDRAQNVRSYGASVPKWDGKPVGTLVIHGEQGLGDEIMFMSCFSKVAAKRIIVECAERLVPLFERSFDATCYPDHESLMASEQEIDAWIPMGDLPFLLGIDRADQFIYSNLDIETPVRERPLVGLAWYGGTSKTHSKLRNPPAEAFADLVQRVPGVDFISVQYNSEDAENEAERIGVPHDMEIAANVDDLTGRIDSCDIIVSVLQTAVHQAGGLGKRCLVPTPKSCPWPFQLEGKMPWYKSVELIRGDWNEVFDQIAGELTALSERQAA